MGDLFLQCTVWNRVFRFDLKVSILTLQRAGIRYVLSTMRDDLKAEIARALAAAEYSHGSRTAKSTKEQDKDVTALHLEKAQLAMSIVHRLRSGGTTH